MTNTLEMKTTHRIRSGSYTMRNRAIGLQSFLAAAALVLSSFAMAQNQPQSLEDVVRAMQQERQAVAEANREREERFRRQETNREQELRRIRNQVEEAEAEASRLEDLRNRLDRDLTELRDQLAERQGEFGELVRGRPGSRGRPQRAAQRFADFDPVSESR